MGRGMHAGRSGTGKEKEKNKTEKPQRNHPPPLLLPTSPPRLPTPSRKTSSPPQPPSSPSEKKKTRQSARTRTPSSFKTKKTNLLHHPLLPPPALAREQGLRPRQLVHHLLVGGEDPRAPRLDRIHVQPQDLAHFAAVAPVAGFLVDVWLARGRGPVSPA